MGWKVFFLSSLLMEGMKRHECFVSIYKSKAIYYL